MNMEYLRDCIAELIWDPTIDYLDKVKRVKNILNLAYAIGYSTGVDDTKSAVLKAIYNELGE